MEITNKTALVTGGTDGIGLEIARQLMAKGASGLYAAVAQTRWHRRARKVLRPFKLIFPPPLAARPLPLLWRIGPSIY